MLGRSVVSLLIGFLCFSIQTPGHAFGRRAKLITAIEQEDYEAANKLLTSRFLRKRVTLRFKLKDQSTPLHSALVTNNCNIIKLLLKKDPQILSSKYEPNDILFNAFQHHRKGFLCLVQHIKKPNPKSWNRLIDLTRHSKILGNMDQLMPLVKIPFYLSYFNQQSSISDPVKTALLLSKQKISKPKSSPRQLERNNDSPSQLSINPAHLEFLKQDPLDGIEDAQHGDVELTAINLFKLINYQNPAEPGYIPPDEYYEDKRQLEFITSTTVHKTALDFFRHFIGQCRNNTRQSKQLNIIVKLLNEIDVTDPMQLLTRNRILVEMAMAGTHCMTRRMDVLDKALTELLPNSGLMENKSFPQQVYGALKNWRKELIAQNYPQPGNEYAHNKIFWLQKLGTHLGLPEHPPIENFPFPAYLDAKSSMSTSNALSKFFYELYLPKDIIHFIKEHIENPSGEHHPPELDVKYQTFYQWVQNSQMEMSDLVDPEDYLLTERGVYKILNQLEVLI